MIIRYFLTCTFLCATFLIEAQTGSNQQQSGKGHVSSGIEQQADQLYRQGLYTEASIAYERILFDNGDTVSQFHAVIGKTQCLKKQQLFNQAVAFLQAYLVYPFPDTALARIHSQLILCTYLAGHFENTISLADRWSYTHAGSPPPSELTLLKILSLNELQHWTAAGEAYRAFIADKQLAIPVPDLYNELPRLKSVTKAQWLATFIPGGGQFYAGKPAEAMASILIQAAGIYFGVLSWEQHYYISAWLVGAALFGSFHMGGVRRSEILVERYNRKRIDQFNEKVKAQLLEVANATR